MFVSNYNKYSQETTNLIELNIQVASYKYEDIKSEIQNNTLIQDFVY